MVCRRSHRRLDAPADTLATRKVQHSDDVRMMGYDTGATQSLSHARRIISCPSIKVRLTYVRLRRKPSGGRCVRARTIHQGPPNSNDKRPDTAGWRSDCSSAKRATGYHYTAPTTARAISSRRPTSPQRVEYTTRALIKKSSLPAQLDLRTRSRLEIIRV
jgi:hypothetical protein